MENNKLKSNVSLKQFLSNLIYEIFGVEGRLPKTLKVLLFHPGKLTKEYFNESSSKYIPPTTLYFSVNLIFFLLLPFINTENSKFLAFSYSGFTWIEGFHSSLIKTVLQNSTFSVEEFKILFDTTILFNQPALIFIIIPFLALLLKIIEIRKKNHYIEHLVVSFHFLSFFLIIFLIISSISSFSFWILKELQLRLPIFYIVNLLLLVLVLLILGYFYQNFRKYYMHSILESLWKTVIAFIGFMIIVVGYVNFLFLYTLLKIS